MEECDNAGHIKAKFEIVTVFVNLKFANGDAAVFEGGAFVPAFDGIFGKGDFSRIPNRAGSFGKNDILWGKSRVVVAINDVVDMNEIVAIEHILPVKGEELASAIEGDLFEKKGLFLVSIGDMSKTKRSC